MGVHFANHTTRLRIGTVVSLETFYHPLRLAAEVALLDVISGGRVNYGADSGFDSRAFAAFGTDREQRHARFRENFNVVLKAWSSDNLDFEEHYQNYEGLEVPPKPVQSPNACLDGGIMTESGDLGGGIRPQHHDGSALFDRSDFSKYALYREQMKPQGHS